MRDSALKANGALSTNQNLALVQNTQELAARTENALSSMNVANAFRGPEKVALAFLNMDDAQVTESVAQATSRVVAELPEGVDIGDPEIVGNIDRITRDYNMTPGQAATLITNSLTEEPWIIDLILGDNNANWDKLNKFVAKVYNRDGKTVSERLAPGVELERSFRIREAEVMSVTQGREALDAASVTYFSILKMYESNPTPELKKERDLALKKFQLASKNLNEILVARGEKTND